MKKINKISVLKIHEHGFLGLVERALPVTNSNANSFSLVFCFKRYPKLNIFSDNI